MHHFHLFPLGQELRCFSPLSAFSKVTWTRSNFHAFSVPSDSYTNFFLTGKLGFEIVLESKIDTSCSYLILPSLKQHKFSLLYKPSTLRGKSCHSLEKLAVWYSYWKSVFLFYFKLLYTARNQAHEIKRLSWRSHIACLKSPGCYNKPFQISDKWQNTVVTLRRIDLVTFGLTLVLEAFKVFQDDLFF